MHDFTMPHWAINRGMQRRGKLHVFDDMVPCKTALVVVDLQNGFMVPEHTSMPVKTSIGIVPNVNRLAATLRATGGKVFWIQNTTKSAGLGGDDGEAARGDQGGSRCGQTGPQPTA